MESSLVERIARIGNGVLTGIVYVFIGVMFFYGGYSLWDTAMLHKNAYVSEELLQYKPSMEDMESPTLSELKKINPDVCGWLTIEDTHVDYPVVQGSDDMEYINKDVYGQFSLSGSIFLDSRNDPLFKDSYSLIYGHHMDYGGMFGDLVKYVDEKYFQNHGKGMLYVSDQRAYSIEIFACIKVDAFDTQIYNPTMIESGNLSPLLSYIRKIAVQYREIQIQPKERIIGCSTCSASETNGRIVVFGVIREGGIECSD